MEESLNNIHSELISRLYKPLIFYVPRKFWVEIDGEKWNDKEFDSLFDTVVLMKTDGTNKALKNGASNYYLMSKTAELDKNTYVLIDMKSKLDFDSFQLLADKYSLNVAFYKKISIWMLNHIQEDVPDANKETLLSFELQKTAFENHWNYIQKHFVSSTITQSSASDFNLNSNDFDTINSLIGHPILSKEETDKFPKKKKKEKKVLLTGEDAERFLLETVFNVKL